MSVPLHPILAEQGGEGVKEWRKRTKFYFKIFSHYFFCINIRSFFIWIFGWAGGEGVKQLEEENKVFHVTLFSSLFAFSYISYFFIFFMFSYRQYCLSRGERVSRSWKKRTQFYFAISHGCFFLQYSVTFPFVARYVKNTWFGFKCFNDSCSMLDCDDV